MGLVPENYQEILLSHDQLVFQELKIDKLKRAEIWLTKRIGGLVRGAGGHKAKPKLLFPRTKGSEGHR